MRYAHYFQLMVLVLFLGGFALGRAGADSQSDLPRLLLVGDSISIGYTADTRKLLEGQVRVYHAPGNNGPTMRGVQRIDQWLGNEPWDVIHFNFGLHDIVYMDGGKNRHARPTEPGAGHQVSAADYEQNLCTLVTRLKETGAKLIWSATTPVPEGTRYRVAGDEIVYNRIAARVMEEAGIPVLDLHAFAAPRLQELQRPADVHFLPQGCRALAAQIAAAVVPLLTASEPDAHGAVAGRLAASTFIPVTDTNRVTRRGEWVQAGGKVDGRARNRYCWPLQLRTKTPGASLDLDFAGTGLAAVFATPRVRAYGSHWKNARARVVVDGRAPYDFAPDMSASEVLILDDLPAGAHRAVFEHLTNGCTLAGFRIFHAPVGHITALVTGDHPDKFFDVRVTAWQGQKLVRESLNRNWLCDRLAVTGLPSGSGYRIRISAVGWLPWERDDIDILAGETLDIGPIHLQQDPATQRSVVTWPALGEQAVRIPGESFHVRGGEGVWTGARLVRRSGPAIISRIATLEGDTVHLPDQVPAGVYDLHLVDAAGNPSVSPRSVVVRRAHVTGESTVLGWGHTDTWGQHQAEFEQVLVAIANIVAPDVVLVSNSLNPAYVAGAMADLRSPYVIHFGNHALPGHEEWFGDEVGLLDVGPNVVVFNFGHVWRKNKGTLAALMASRTGIPCKMLNSLESDYPIELLRQHHVGLAHDAHGWLKPKVLKLPGTDTMRVGKVSASSFHIIRTEDGRVVSVSEALEVPRIGDPDAPVVPPPPLRVVYDPSTVEIINELSVAIPRARAVLVLPRGEYRTTDAEIDAAVVSDDGTWIELTLHADVEAHATRQIVLKTAGR